MLSMYFFIESEKGLNLSDMEDGGDTASVTTYVTLSSQRKFSRLSNSRLSGSR